MVVKKKLVCRAIFLILLFGVMAVLVHPNQVRALTYNNNCYFNGQQYIHPNEEQDCTNWYVDETLGKKVFPTGSYTQLEYNVEELVRDGLYQAYCAASKQTGVKDFSLGQYRTYEMAFDNAYVSLLRNRYGTAGAVNRRLASTEAYFGHVEPYDNQHRDIHNSFYASITTMEQQCISKMQMLLGIYTACEKNDDGDGKFTLREQCDEFNCPRGIIGNFLSGSIANPDCDLYQANKKIGQTNHTILSLLQNYVLPNHFPIVNTAECHNLMTDNASSSSQRGQDRDAVFDLPFYNDNAERTGYILEAVKLCQPCRLPETITGDPSLVKCSPEQSEIFTAYNPKEGSSDCNPGSETGNLKTEPDMLRVFPFLLPNVLANAHNNSPEMNYRDPSHLPYEAVSSLSQQQTDMAITAGDKAQVIETPVEDCKDFYPINRCKYSVYGTEEISDRNTLAVLVNKTHTSGNTFNNRYGVGDMTCEGGLGRPPSAAEMRRVVSDAWLEDYQGATSGIEQGGNDEDFFNCRTWNTQDDGGAWNDCGVEKLYENTGLTKGFQCGERYEPCWNQVPCPTPDRPNLMCWQLKADCQVHDYAICTSADISWWAVTPSGYDTEKVEAGLRAQYAQMSTWAKAQSADPRITKRVSLLDYEGGPGSLSVLGGGGGTDVFGVQGFLYPYGSEVWNAVNRCKNLEDYYLSSCNGTYHSVAGGPAAGRFGSSGSGSRDGEVYDINTMDCCTAEKINSYIDNYANGRVTPLAGQGELLMELGRENGVNPCFIVGTLQAETSLGINSNYPNNPCSVMKGGSFNWASSLADGLEACFTTPNNGYYDDAKTLLDYRKVYCGRFDSDPSFANPNGPQTVNGCTVNDYTLTSSGTMVTGCCAGCSNAEPGKCNDVPAGSRWEDIVGGALDAFRGNNCS